MLGFGDGYGSTRVNAPEAVTILGVGIVLLSTVGLQSRPLLPQSFKLVLGSAKSLQRREARLLSWASLLVWHGQVRRSLVDVAGSGVDIALRFLD
jgi:hypothetical protein